MKLSFIDVLSLVVPVIGVQNDVAHSGVKMQRSPGLSERASSNFTTLTPQFFTSYGSKRTEVRYGPFTVEGIMSNNGMDDFVITKAQMPCSDCLITWMQAGLMYPNGTYANSNTSFWLHHTVLSNVGKPDPVCGSGSDGTNFFASGNERTAINICQNGTEMAGYYIGPTDQIGFLAELMNELMDPQTAIVTITYEYIPSPSAQFARVTPLWLDIGNCNSSEVPPTTNTTSEYTMDPWRSTVRGRITELAGHVHDGGIDLMTMKGNMTMLCDAMASYGQTPGYVETGAMDMGSAMSGMPMENMTMTHVSSISTCNGGMIEVGDVLSITANYDFTKHMGMTDTNGALMPIMGIAIAYVNTAVNSTSSDNTTSNGTMSGSTSTSTSAGTIFSVPIWGTVAAMMLAYIL